MSGGGAERLAARVTGRVQGVGFRYFVTQHARRLGLTGRVRNTPDGAVTLEAEGPRPDLERLLAHLREGPSAASVAHVEAAWAAAEGEHADFRAER